MGSPGRAGGARPPTSLMVTFIDEHRAKYGVEPICRVLPTATSTYYAAKVVEDDPTRASLRAQRDVWLCGEIRRAWQQNSFVYGARKVWLQLNREGIPVAGCTVERLTSTVKPALESRTRSPGPSCSQQHRRRLGRRTSKVWTLWMSTPALKWSTSRWTFSLRSSSWRMGLCPQRGRRPPSPPPSGTTLGEAPGPEAGALENTSRTRASNCGGASRDPRNRAQPQPRLSMVARVVVAQAATKQRSP